MRPRRDHIFDHTPESLAAWCAQRGMAPYRAEQILDWVYRKGVADPVRMSNLSKRDREVLAAEMTFVSGVVLGAQTATDGTEKLLVQWEDQSPSPLAPLPEGEGEARVPHPRPLPRGEGEARVPHSGASPGGEADRRLRVLNGGRPPFSTFPCEARERGSPLSPALSHGERGSEPRDVHQEIPLDPSRQTECVMIPSDGRRTACISSQVGCPVGCRFCASGLGGLDANLSAGRIVEQVWLLSQLPGVERISHVVFMGMGEPLANFNAVKGAVETIAAPWGMGISARRITISTVGLPKYINRLAAELDLPVTLALSLHAPTDEIRRELIPWSEYTTIEELIAACRAWFEKTGREVTLEYTLLREVNDRPEHAVELARIAKALRGNVNLIRYNEVAGLEFRRPRDADVREFQRVLRNHGVNAHIRASRGRDIAAACGQLRHEATAAG